MKSIYHQKNNFTLLFTFNTHMISHKKWQKPEATLSLLTGGPNTTCLTLDMEGLRWAYITLQVSLDSPWHVELFSCKQYWIDQHVVWGPRSLNTIYKPRTDEANGPLAVTIIPSKQCNFTCVHWPNAYLALSMLTSMLMRSSLEKWNPNDSVTQS